MRGPAGHRIDRRGAGLQALTQHRVLEVGACLIEGPDRIALRHRAGPQTCKLRKDEPHPVAALVARLELLQGLLIDAVLRIDEPHEVKGIWHPGITPPASLESAACGLPYAVNGDGHPVAEIAADPFTVIAILGCTVGPYTFAVALSSDERKSYFYRISCEVGLHVDDQDPIVPANSKLVVQTQGDFQRTFVGAANLEEGAHPIDLSVVCSFTNGTQGQTADDFFDGPLGVRNVFDAIQVSVTVFGPNDMQARIPQVDELIHNVTGASP